MTALSQTKRRYAREQAIPTTLDNVFREAAAQITASLTRHLGPQHLSLAEDAVQETFIKALHAWTYKGLPDNPRAWLTTVARNQALDILRRERLATTRQGDILLLQELTSREDELEQVHSLLDGDLADDLLLMMFTCCHPALPRESQVALTLKTLCGFGVAEIARAFLADERAIAQRLVRAKRTLRDQRVSFTPPEPDELPTRLQSVLDVLYLLFSEGYSAHQGESLVRHELCREAVRLTTLLTEHEIGDLPEVHALLALMLLQASRLPARVDAHGNLLLLEEQDRGRWDQTMIHAGLQELLLSATGERLTAYHLQAEIAAVHAVAPNYAATDWQRILTCYDELLQIIPSPIVALNRAVALAMVEGPEAGLRELDRIRTHPGMERYYLLHCTAAEFWRRTGDIRRAMDHYHHASTFTITDPERRFLEGRMLEIEDAGPVVTTGREQ